jgi:hypothetical protein
VIVKKAYLLIAAAFLVHTVAWFLPVDKDGVTLPDGLPGWQAFEMAANEVVKWKIDPWWFVVLLTMSAVTTIFSCLEQGG